LPHDGIEIRTPATMLRGLVGQCLPAPPASMTAPARRYGAGASREMPSDLTAANGTGRFHRETVATRGRRLFQLDANSFEDAHLRIEEATASLLMLRSGYSRMVVPGETQKRLNAIEQPRVFEESPAVEMIV
jgi:hypothetical protein